MKIYKTKKQIEKDIIDNQLTINDDVRFECDFDFPNCNIIAWDINAGDINAGDITADDINAGDITADDINAGDITAFDIKANNITAGDITADDINANNIIADNISYYAVCFAYYNIKCKSITGCRENSKHFCLDSEIKIKEE
ncbi:hypothetical protein EOM09_07580 [bacterium]|nr:hypothetical protein [bacterium]